jgi:hypothetical protein
MRDFVLDAPDQDRYTYFFAFYGKDYQHRTGLLHVQHDFTISTRDLHILIRNRIDNVLSKDTPACFHIIALASPEPIPCGASN